MLAAAASAWEAVPTELDELWCPSIEFVSGGAESRVTLLVEGGAQPSRPLFEGERHYVLRFSGVEAISGYAEALYCTFVRPADPSEPTVRTKIQRARRSDLVDKAAELRRSELAHYAVFGGDMQCEIVASPEFDLSRHPTRDDALKDAMKERPIHTTNLEAGQPDAQAFLASLTRAREATDE